MRIVINSGHAGREYGAIGFGVMEKDLNRVFADLLGKKLTNLSFEVDTTLVKDKYYEPNELTDLIKQSGASICISCHCNAYDGSARGLEIIYSIHSDGRLANLILSEVKKTGYITRTAYSRESSRKDGTDYYFVIRQTYPDVQTIIVEFGFIDNINDNKLLTDKDWQDKLTTAVAAGIKDYVQPANNTRTPISGASFLTKKQLEKALLASNPVADSKIIDTYYSVSPIYGIKADLAFLQSMWETNWLKFTGSVKPEQNNFAGLGATGNGIPGLSFPSMEAGVEAHLQHLYAYCSTLPLPSGRTLYDSRFPLVIRGSAVNWEDLDGKWAVSPGYGEKIISMQQSVGRLYPDNNPVQPPGDKPEDSNGENTVHWAKADNDELLQNGILLQDHSNTLNNPATEGMVLSLINRIRKLINN